MRTLKRLPVAQHDLVLADASDIVSVAGIEYIQRGRADVLGRVISSLRRVLAGGDAFPLACDYSGYPDGTGGRVAGHFERPDIIVWRPGLL